jgi:uncharacterized membrane protein YedE/YeeE
MNNVWKQFRGWFCPQRQFEDPIKEWERLQAIGEKRYLVEEASRIALIALVCFGVSQWLKEYGFTLDGGFYGSYLWFLNSYVFLGFLVGWGSARKHWENAETQYQEAIKEQSANTPSLAPAQAAPVIQSATPGRVHQP